MTDHQPSRAGRDRDGVTWSAVSDQLNLNTVALHAGGQMPHHVNDEVDVAIVCTAGTGALTIDGTDHELRPGSAAIVPRGAERTITATSDLQYATIHHRRRGPTIGRARERSVGDAEAVEPAPNRTDAVNPSAESLAALAARPDGNAIIMVNLLRFDPDGGREAYGRYGAVASQTVKARGGSIAYTAPVIGPDPEWDTVTLVRYPRRAAYLDMQNDPAYVGAIPDRTRGLSARLLHPFHSAAGDPDDPFRIERSGGEEVFVVSLVRYSGNPESAEWLPDGDIVLRLTADVALVTDDPWDELVVARYPSPAELPAWLGESRAGVEASIVLVTRPDG